MDQKDTTPTSDSIQLPLDPDALAKVSSDSQDEQPGAPTDTNTATTTVVTPFIHPLMIPQFNGINALYYWPYPHPAMNPFAPFPQLQVPHFPWLFPIAPWYYFQQAMIASPAYAQAMTFGVPPPPVTPQSPISQSTNTGPATSITNNFVTYNEIGNNSSTNLRIHKNGHRCTGSG